MDIKNKNQKAIELFERINEERGFVMPWRKILCERDPEYMELYHNISSYVFNKRSSIPRKYKELITIALDVVTKGENGLPAHMQNAMQAGATEEEILEVLELTSLLSIHNLSEHLQLLEDESKKYKENKENKA